MHYLASKSRMTFLKIFTLIPYSQYEPVEDTANNPPLFGICPAGHYCPDEGTAEPLQCPDGFYQENTGQTECSDKCPEGYVCSGVKITFGQTDECPAGYYCPDEGTIWQTIEPCPKGTYRDANMNTPASSSDDCEVNNFNPSTLFCVIFGLHLQYEQKT